MSSEHISKRSNSQNKTINTYDALLTVRILPYLKHTKTIILLKVGIRGTGAMLTQTLSCLLQQ